MTKMKAVDDFLSHKRLAVVGVSHQPKDFSRALFHEFQVRGYDVVPVNPAVQDIDGQRCFARVQDITPPVEGALLMTAPAVTSAVVRDCAAAGIPRVWLFRGEGRGSVSGDAVRFCESNGMTVVPGECPFMFLPGGAWFHRIHAIIRKITGSYPH